MDLIMGPLIVIDGLAYVHQGVHKLPKMTISIYYNVISLLIFVVLRCSSLPRAAKPPSGHLTQVSVVSLLSLVSTQQFHVRSDTKDRPSPFV